MEKKKLTAAAGPQTDRQGKQKQQLRAPLPLKRRPVESLFRMWFSEQPQTLGN